MEQDSTTAAIESAIAHIPDDGGAVDSTDLAPDTSTDEAVADPVTTTDDTGETVAASTETPDPETDPAPAAETKKTPKYVPWHRFDSQTKGKQAAEKALADAKAQHEADIAAYREKALAFDTLENNPERAVEVLLADPRYAGLLTRKQAEAAVDAIADGKDPAKAIAKAAPAAPVADEPPPFPQPDVELSDGSLTYKPETLQKYMRDVAAFERSAGQKELRAEIEALKKELGDRVQPFEQIAADEKLAKDSLKARTTEYGELESHFGKEFVEEHKDAMMTWLRDQWGKDATGRQIAAAKNPKAGLQQAMYAVLIPAMKAAAKKSRDEALAAADTAKARAIAEQNTRAAAAGERPSAAGVSKETRQRSPEDIINAAIDRAGLAA